MPELHMNGNYENYLAQLFNPLAGGGQANSGIANSGIYGGIGNTGMGAALGGVGVGAVPNGAFPLQNPLAGQGLASANGLWPQQQQQQALTVAAVQLAQQIVARQAVQAIQCAQALQTLLQLLHEQTAQQMIGGSQMQLGHGLGGGLPIGQFGAGLGQANAWGAQQNQTNQALQQQALLQQLAQTLATQQPQPFRYGLAA